MLNLKQALMTAALAWLTDCAVADAAEFMVADAAEFMSRR